MGKRNQPPSQINKFFKEIIFKGTKAEFNKSGFIRMRIFIVFEEVEGYQEIRRFFKTKILIAPWRGKRFVMFAPQLQDQSDRAALEQLMKRLKEKIQPEFLALVSEAKARNKEGGVTSETLCFEISTPRESWGNVILKPKKLNKLVPLRRIEKLSGILNCVSWEKDGN